MIAAVIGCMLAGSAHAATITEIIFRGQGVVDVSIPGTVDGLVITPAVGTPVAVTGKVFFGNGVAATDATGMFVCCGSQSLTRIEVSLAGVGDFYSVDENNGSNIELGEGSVLQFFLGASFAGNGGGGFLSEADFQFENAIAPVCDETGFCITSSLVRGSWSVTDTEILTSVVPEPAAWLLMIFGFGMVGGGLRRRRPRGIAAALVPVAVFA